MFSYKALCLARIEIYEAHQLVPRLAAAATESSREKAICYAVSSVM